MTVIQWNSERHARAVILASEAVLQQERWDELVGEISQALGGNGGALFTPAPDRAGRALGASAGTGADALPGFAARWAPEDPWFKAVSRLGRPWLGGTIHTADELVPTETLFGTAFYNEFSKPHGIENIISLKIVGDHESPAPPTHLSLFQQRRDRSMFGKTQRRALTALLPHLQRAVHAHWSLRNARNGDSVAEGTMDAVPQPAWILRDDLYIDHANHRARELMGSAPWLRASARRLSSIGDLDSVSLREAVRCAEVGGGRLWVAGISMNGRLRRAALRIAPLRGFAPFATAWPHARALLSLELPAPDQASTLWSMRLAHHYRLTTAEVRVLERLSAGLSPHEIAAEMGVSYTTTRAHLRALFDKTGCHRQADLVRLGVGA